jgi:hypothetical protein
LVSWKSNYLRPSDYHLVSSKSLILRPSDNHLVHCHVVRIWVCSICINRLSICWSYSQWGSMSVLIVLLFIFFFMPSFTINVYYKFV